jgi:hypothetical protein
MNDNYTWAKVKVGDRILYHDRGSPTQRYIGRKGVVASVRNNDTTADVVFDGDERSSQVSTANIELLPELTVESAIALLQKHGTVTFVPTFKPITIKLNGEYHAVVHQDHVQVGCQKFSFDAVLALAETVTRVTSAK